MLDDALQQIIRDVLGDDEIALDPSTSAQDVEGWDSLAHINIMVAVESAYGVTFSSQQLSGFDDLGALQTYLREHAR